jgi:hypothetical protein
MKEGSQSDANKQVADHQAGTTIEGEARKEQNKS